MDDGPKAQSPICFITSNYYRPKSDETKFYYQFIIKITNSEKKIQKTPRHVNHLFSVANLHDPRVEFVSIWGVLCESKQYRELVRSWLILQVFGLDFDVFTTLCKNYQQSKTFVGFTSFIVKDSLQNGAGPNTGSPSWKYEWAIIFFYIFSVSHTKS